MFVPSNWIQYVTKVLDDYCRAPDRFGPEYDQLFDKLVCTEQAESWDEFCRWSSELDGWGFRGQREAGWPLQTSLERVIRVAYFHGNNGGHHNLDRETEGQELLRRFQEQAPRYIHSLPPKDDMGSWLALMQHYGAPTRLLDWTDSAYVALYFAIEKQGAIPAIWAIDLNWLERRGRELLTSKGLPPVPFALEPRRHCLNAVLSAKKMPLIVRIDPLENNPRMVVQRGFFLWKLFEETPFFDQILTSMIIHPEIPSLPVIRKLKVPSEQRVQFLERLGGMDIHRTALFPVGHNGTQRLEVFCHSLKLNLQKKVSLEEEQASQELRDWRETHA